MSWDLVSPFMCGRQLRRFFDKHCTTIDMRGFNEDDWVLMTYCPIEDSLQTEDLFPLDWVTNTEKLRENQTWWRKEMMKLFPTALPEKDEELSDDHKDMFSIDTHRETVGLGLSDESLNLTSLADSHKPQYIKLPLSDGDYWQRLDETSSGSSLISAHISCDTSSGEFLAKA